MGTNKITRFLVKQDKQPAARGVGSSGQRQGTIEEMRKVQKLHKSSMCADDEELFRLLEQLAEHQPDEVIDKALKHLASYVLHVEQLERVPLAPRVKQLRQHDNPSISRTATRLIEKLREEFTAATLRKRSKPVVKQQAKLITKSPLKQPPAKP